MKKKNTISYPKERIELNKMLYEECLKTPLNPTAIQNLLHQGADCLGAIDENPLNYDTHLFGELIGELSMRDGRNLPRITKLFLDAGMDIEKPAIPYVDGDSINPLWELAFCANRNGIRTLKMLLDSGISKESADECWSHLITDTAYVYDGDLHCAYNLNHFISTLKMLMLIASNEEWVKSDPSLQFWIGYQHNDYDLKKFRNCDSFIYEIDYSKARSAWNHDETTYDPVPNGSIVRIYEKKTNKLVWAFVYGSENSPN
jgi:hypothetical protein